MGANLEVRIGGEGHKGPLHLASHFVHLSLVESKLNPTLALVSLQLGVNGFKALRNLQFRVRGYDGGLGA